MSAETYVQRIKDACVEWALMKNENKPMTVEEIQASILQFNATDHAVVVRIADSSRAASSHE